VKDEKLYAFFTRRSFSYKWLPCRFKGETYCATKRFFADALIFSFCKEGYLFEASYKDFVEDMKDGISTSKYAKMLGWNYKKACDFLAKEGTVFILNPYADHPACPYSYNQTRDDDEYALNLVRDIFFVTGGDMWYEEYDPLRHVDGYNPFD
jgi:hypothetical protein